MMRSLNYIREIFSLNRIGRLKKKKKRKRKQSIAFLVYFGEINYRLPEENVSTLMPWAINLLQSDN